MNNASMNSGMIHGGMTHGEMNHSGTNHSGMNHGGPKKGSFVDPMDHMNDPVQKLIDTTRHTHVAVRSGAWSNPNTWSNGKVPGNNAKVLIRKGTVVTYDQVSDVRLETVSVEGNLKFATNKDTQIKVKTILNGASGRLDIGSAGQSVAADKQAQIIFTSDSGIDTKWDPKQLSKGLVSHGIVNIYGADKADKLELAGDVKKGDSVLRFKETPKGWKVGDRIVLGGTQYIFRGKDSDNSRFQDEVLTVTSIKGKEVRFVNEDIKSGKNNVTRYDHTRSQLASSADKLSLYVGNLSRNVSFETENGKNVPINRRAHVMLMHNPNVKVLNAGFYELGRSDKSKPVDDVGRNVDGSKGNGTNVRGRYALHLHRTGADDINGQAAILRGNAVEGSPGWGIVQHDSHAGLEDNVVFDVVGAGIAAESGNEIGWWTDNLTIKTTGISLGQAQKERNIRERRYDFGIQGTGFWVQGAGLIKNKDNVAISSNQTGMEVFGSVLEPHLFMRDATTLKVNNLPPELRKLFPASQKEVDIRDVPMAEIDGFESYNASIGLRIWAHNTNFDGELYFSTPYPKTAHEGRSLIKNAKLWENRFGGAFVEYSSNVDIKDSLILGRDKGPLLAGGQGLFNNQASYGSEYDNLTIAGFTEGIDFDNPNTDKAHITTSLSNSTVIGNAYNLGKVGGPIQQGVPDDYAAFVKFKNNRFSDAKNNKAPIARFKTKALGGLAVELDASASQDLDPLRNNNGSLKKLASKGIAGYGWDLDGNGSIDAFGRTISHVFDRAGNKNVVLTVLDSQGKATQLKQTVKVQPSAYVNAFEDGDFGRETKTQGRSNSQGSDQGWFVSNGVRVKNGFAQLSKSGDRNNFMGQVTRNDRVHRGQQTLSFKLKNLEGAAANKAFEQNEVTVRLWGINGQFNNDRPRAGEGPSQVGTLPMQRTALVTKTFTKQNGGFFDWKKISLDVNLGKGYDYLMVQVNADKSNHPKDFIAIDDISLMGKANAIGGNPLPPGGGGNPPTPPTEPLPPVNPPVNPPSNPPSNPKPPTQNPTPPGDIEPVVRLSFDENNGMVTAVDSSTAGQKNNGRLMGPVRRQNGKFGKAVTFQGNNSRVAINNSEDINLGINPERTISMWFKTNDASSDRKQVLYEEGGRTRGLNMYVKDKLLYFGGWSNKGNWGDGDWVTTRPNQVKSGRWHHVALVLDGDDKLKPNTLTAYLDGRKVGSEQGTQMWRHVDRIGIGNVNGSTRFADGSRGNRWGLMGSVDEFHLYNDALSASDVRKLADNTPFL